MILLAVAGVAAGNPLPPPPEISTRADMLARLDAEYQGAALRAARAVAAAAWLHRDLVDTLLASSYDRVRAVGVSALETIGDDAARQRLVRVLADTSEVFGVRITAAESLALLGVEAARPHIAALERTDDPVRRRAAARALRALDDPLVYRPLITREEGVLRYAFLLDDLVSVEVGSKRYVRDERRSRFVPLLTFDASEHAGLLDLLQLHEPTRTSSFVVDTRLRLTLRDGRVADFILDRTLVCYTGPSRWWQGAHFVVDAPAFTDRVNARLAAIGLPSIGSLQGVVRNR